MDEIVVDKKYVDYIENLLSQIPSLLPDDVNELQKNYLIKNIRKAAMLMASSIEDNEEFKALDFDQQCFYIQVISEWSFHKEIDLFRSGIPVKYWKTVMQKIWYATWEVMFACVKNDAPDSVVLSLVERFVNRTYKEAIEELKLNHIIDKEVEEKAKEQSNIEKMAKEYQASKETENVKNGIRNIIIKIITALIIVAVVTFSILKFKLVGLSIILSIIIIYIFLPNRE